MDDVIASKEVFYLYFKKRNREDRTQANQFEKENLQDFLIHCPKNVEDWWPVIASVIISLYGLLRISENLEFKFEYLTFLSAHVKCSRIAQGKQRGRKTGDEYFCIYSEDVINLLKQYVELFPIEMRKGRLVRYVIVSGSGGLTGTLRPIGKNTLQDYGKFIAAFLAKSGATTIQLQRAGNWMSPRVAEGYVGRSLVSKKATSDVIGLLLNAESSSSETTATTSNASLIVRATGHRQEEPEPEQVREPEREREQEPGTKIARTEPQ